MPLLVAFLAAIVLAIVIYHLANRVPSLPRTGRDWGVAGSDDPRVVVAAMMYAVATEDGPLTPAKERRILALLSSTVGLGPELAKTCLTGGKRLARRLGGDLNARLHQLLAPIERQCSPEEKQDVIAMLRDIAGPSADRLGPVRDGLGRLTSSLLHG
jgi:uncharacterized tellurite resistance protein B-like protein